MERRSDGRMGIGAKGTPKKGEKKGNGQMKKENKTQKWKSKTSSRKKKSHVLLLINFPRELLESCFRFQYHG